MKVTAETQGARGQHRNVVYGSNSHERGPCDNVVFVNAEVAGKLLWVSRLSDAFVDSHLQMGRGGMGWDGVE